MVYVRDKVRLGVQGLILTASLLRSTVLTFCGNCVAFSVKVLTSVARRLRSNINTKISKVKSSYVVPTLTLSML